MTNADEQTVIVSDSVCDFARSKAPECADKVVNETNFEYFGYKIDVSACESLLTSLRSYSCEGWFEACNLEYLLDTLLVLNIVDAFLELLALLNAIATVLGSFWTPDTAPEGLLYVI